MLQEAFTRLNYIGDYLVTDNECTSYQVWLRAFVRPILDEVGWEPKPGESDEQKTLRARLFTVFGFDARDPEVLAQARKIADAAIANPDSVDRELATSALSVAALTGGEEFYDKLMAELRTAKAPEEYYAILFTLPQFDDPKLLERTLNFAISPDVRSQDALNVINNMMHNPAGQKLAWNFVLDHWDAVQKAGGTFASAEIVSATGLFCDARMRDQVKNFYAAHKIEAAERTYRQSVELINNCIDLKNKQEPQLASSLGKQGTTAGGE
ncbi:MAG: ERAP1-like C-terminal domain-containing protein [Candidatus Sulfotelmatobacter sp.]